MSTTMVLIAVLAIFLIFLGITGRTAAVINAFREAG